MRFPTTLALALISITTASLIGMVFGIVCAVNQNKTVDYILTLLALLLASMPAFWLALMLILLFAVTMGLLPATGLESWRHWILPTIVLGSVPIATLCRTTRSSMLEVIRQDYIRTAKSKGISDVHRL